MPFHILTAELIQECSTFNQGRTGLDAYRVEILERGDTAIAQRRQARAELKGFLDVAEAEGWRVTHALSATATPGPIVTAPAFETLAGIITDAAQANRDSLDGVLLALHGAMAAEGCDDPEGELLTRLRAILGPDIPIGITLDLHTNTSPAMAEGANVAVSFKTYPHVDHVETAAHAARMLKRLMEGGAKGRTLRLKLPMLDEANGGRSDVMPTAEYYDRARRFEVEPGILAVSVNAGFADADVLESGVSVLVSFDTLTEGAEARARDIALDLARAIWADRDACANRFLTVAEACARARAFQPAKGPLVISDYADNPGAGAYGDATNLLAGLLELGLEGAAFGPLIDPEAAGELHRHRVGATVTLPVGGKHDPRFGGGPLMLTGEIRHLSETGLLVGDGPVIGGIVFRFGKTAVLRVNGVDILIVTERGQAYDLQQFKAFGIEPEACTVLGLKSQQHFRAAFEPIASEVIVCDCGAIASPDYRIRDYRKVRRPIWPLDDIAGTPKFILS